MKRLALTLSMLVMLSACGGDSSTGPIEASVVGAWNLKTINGTALPYTASASGQNKTEYTSDVLTFVAGGAFTDVFVRRYTQNGVVTTESTADAGTFTLQGNFLSFRYNTDSAIHTGTVSGNTLTISSAGFTYVYQK